jgi:hypothetical protein
LIVRSVWLNIIIRKVGDGVVQEKEFHFFKNLLVKGYPTPLAELIVAGQDVGILFPNFLWKFANSMK